MTSRVKSLRHVAAASIVVGLASGCAVTSYAGNPSASIDIKDIGLGYRYSQSGRELDSKHLSQVLKRGGAPVTEDLKGQGAISALGVIFGGLAGGLIGWPLGGAATGKLDQPWFLVAIGAGTASVVFPIEARAGARLHRAVLLHNAHHSGIDPSSVPPLRPLRTSWLARSVFSGGHVSVDETIPSVGSAGHLSLAGPSAGYDWSLGYFVVPGLALSANVVGLTQFTNDVHSRSQPVPNGTQGVLHYTAALGNVTYYFVPELGLFTFAGVGYGVESGESASSVIQPGASGLAVSGGVGWDFTIANSGALGVVLRGLHSPLRGEFPREVGDGSVQDTSFFDRWTGVSVGLSLTYY